MICSGLTIACGLPPLRGFFYINDDGVEQSGLPEEAIQRGEFSATDSHKLLLAGINGAIVFDGVNWDVVF